MMKRIFVIFSSLILSFAFLRIVFAEDVTITANTTWQAGTYTYGSILVTNGATLFFNGAVTLNAHNLTIDPTSSISVDGKGYPNTQGPGAGKTGTESSSGAGYGGRGGNAYSGLVGGSTYGSSLVPVDLGSGGGGSACYGGGAVQLKISNNLTVNGSISARGANGASYGAGGGSGGSIYVVTNTLSGSGSFIANGGEASVGGRGGGGGGGRIALYYQSSSFNGAQEAKGGNGWSKGEDGTVALIDTAQKILYTGSFFRFQENDSPFDFNKVILNNSKVNFEPNVTLSVADDIVLNNNSVITPSALSEISITAHNLTIDPTSSISVDGKGYPNTQGPGAGKTGTESSSGAGYGGRGGNAYSGLVGGSTYGSSLVPVDLGSGGGGSACYGGGAVQLKISNNLTVNGSISARGANGASYGAGGGSGGSIYVVTNTLSGSGSFIANGGEASVGGRGGGGGGGRIALYYQSSSFNGAQEAKGGNGWSKGEDGTVMAQGSLENSPTICFNLTEKSSTINTSIEAISTQGILLGNVNVTGDLRGTLNFIKFETVKIATGPFSQKGFFKAEWEAVLEGINYKGIYKGVIYPDPKERKLHLKGFIDGGLKGIAEAEFTESIPGSNTYNVYLDTWKLNRLGGETIPTTINLEGTSSYQPSYLFNSALYYYQANMEGVCFGYYAGPLNAVVTHIRLTGENEYKDEGFSVISYDSSLGQGEAFSFNQLSPDNNIEFEGLFNGPLLGVLEANLNEAASPRTLIGTIERLDLGVAPAPDLKVRVIAPTRVSPGQTVNYIIEYRNDGLKAATEAIVYNYLDLSVNYKTASEGAYYDPYTHQVSWNLGALQAKSAGYLSIQVEIPRGLPTQLALENNAYILDIVLHSTDENGFCNGIRFNSDNQNDIKMYTKFKSTNNATWFELYDKTNEFTGTLEAYLASKGVSTSRNGVGDISEVVGFRPRWIGYSGGTTTLVNQAKNNHLSGDELYLISPQLVTKED